MDPEMWSFPGINLLKNALNKKGGLGMSGNSGTALSWCFCSSLKLPWDKKDMERLEHVQGRDQSCGILEGARNVILEKRRLRGIFWLCTAP